jgi:hypothetical protein
MKKYFATVLLLAASAFGQYKIEPVGAAPADLGPLTGQMQPAGVKVLSPSGAVYCEVWFRTSVPSGPKSTEEGVSFPAIPQGALIGVIRFPNNGMDRRGQPVQAGVYTLRYSQHPVNGDHLGVAPQRDFLLLSPAAEDKDPAATPDFDTLVAMSRKVSGTPHPAVLSFTTAAAGAAVPHFAKEGDHDWALTGKAGDHVFSLILIGKAEG